MFNKVIKTGLCAVVALAVSGQMLAETMGCVLMGQAARFH